MKKILAADLKPEHFRWEVEDRVATITLDRPERKNPLTFDSYGELRDTFRALEYASDVRAVVITGAGGNFCSGGDVHEIIGPLTKMDMTGLMNFTRMTGEVVIAMRHCPQPIIAAIDGICAGAGAILSMASDLRYGTAQSKVGFLFVRVGLAGCDMGACNMLPRIIGAGRAADLLYTGRMMPGEQAYEYGYYNELCEPDGVLARAQEMARTLAFGPTFAHAMTKRMIHKEWDMGIDESIESEAHPNLDHETFGQTPSLAGRGRESGRRTRCPSSSIASIRPTPSPERRTRRVALVSRRAIRYLEPDGRSQLPGVALPRRRAPFASCRGRGVLRDAGLAGGGSRGE
jgi:enoyl-CoA hydratase/carnithine racemase